MKSALVFILCFILWINVLLGLNYLCVLVSTHILGLGGGLLTCLILITEAAWTIFAYKLYFETK